MVLLVECLIIKFNSVSVVYCPNFLSPAPMSLKWFKVIALHQQLVSLPVNERLPSNTPVYVSLHATKYVEKILSKVFLHLCVSLLSPRPVLPSIHERLNDVGEYLQLTRLVEPNDVDSTGEHV